MKTIHWNGLYCCAENSVSTQEMVDHIDRCVRGEFDVGTRVKLATGDRGTGTVHMTDGDGQAMKMRVHWPDGSTSTHVVGELVLP